MYSQRFCNIALFFKSKVFHEKRRTSDDVQVFVTYTINALALCILGHFESFATNICFIGPNPDSKLYAKGATSGQNLLAWACIPINLARVISLT